MERIRSIILFFSFALLLLPYNGFAQDRPIVRPGTTTTPSQNRQRQNAQQQRQQQQRQAELRRQQQQRQAELQRQQEEAERQRQAELQRQREEEQRQAELQRQREEELRQAELQRQREEAERNRIIQNLIANMVYVEGGTFTMGFTKEQKKGFLYVHTKDDKPQAKYWENPVHQVTVSSFSICKYEVTQEEWEAIMGANPSSYKGPKRPVEQVSWNDCQEFIRKLNEKTGMVFRLPTEAEWEFAARGGNKSQHYRYAGSNIASDVTYYEKFQGTGVTTETKTVGGKKPNELGLFDMSGNVKEWCQDWFGRYNSEPQTNPVGPNYGTSRVLRGGCNGTYISVYTRVSARSQRDPDDSFRTIGFRLALSE